MQYELENVTCQHCKEWIEKVTVQHGFVFDFFKCPHCGEQNQVR